MRALLLPLVAALCCASTSLGAQTPEEPGRDSLPIPQLPARGLFLGARVGASTMMFFGEDASGDITRPIYGLRFGWSLSPRFAISVAMDAAAESRRAVDSGIANFELAGRWTFVGARRPWSPYVEGGLGWRSARIDDYEHPRTGAVGALDVSGPMVVLGGGTEWFVSRTIVVDFGLSAGRSRFSSVDFIGPSGDDRLEIGALSVRGLVGVSFHPERGRDRR